jgi:4-coumarate--CoA ligase
LVSQILISILSCLQGYYSNPEATAQALDEQGFFKTGDIGYFDENHFLYIVDRKKDILKYKGFQFNPSEIESVIEVIEGVEMVAVVGLPDPIVTDLPTAVVVRRKGFEDLTEEKILRVVAEKLPVNKHLHGGVFFVDELPMTLSGKIKKNSVIEMIMKIKSL